MHISSFAVTSLLVFAVLHGTSSFPTGPPFSALLDMYPKHGANPQNGAAPFRVNLSPETYAPGQTISVSVVSTIQGRTFRGFLVTAHRVVSSGNAQEFVGTFNSSDSDVQLLTGLGAMKKAIGHNNNTEKMMINASWTAPDTNVGDLQFLLTVVENITTFWYRVPLNLPAGSAVGVVLPTIKVPSLSVSTSEAPDWTGCEKTKGCWLVPESGNATCTGNDCLVAISFRKDNDQFVFEISFKSLDKYIAVGLSYDKLMGDDQTVTCMAKTDHESIQMGYNYIVSSIKFSYRQFTRGLSNLVVGQEDGRTYCKFTSASILSNTLLNGTREFNLNDKYYMFLAYGDIYEGTIVMEKHTEAPSISSTKVNLAQFSSTSTAVSNVICGTLVASALVFVRLLLQ